MPLLIDSFNKLVKVTSPTTEVSAQVLHDFIEDYMATPVGMANDGQWPGSEPQRGDILKPEGKIEDPSNPGVFSQIILILHPQWQIQFWGGSGYTRIFGGKIVGGVSDQPLKATGTAGDISVLESPVDGVTVAVGSGLSVDQDQKLTDIDTKTDAIEIYSLETWQALGLEVGNKVTITPAGLVDQSGNIVVDFSGDGVTSTVMERQP